jgi:hypothetical protein
MGFFKDELSQSLNVDLDFLSTSTSYTLKVCANFKGDSSFVNPMPVKAYLVQHNSSPRTKISTTDTFTLTSQNQC